MKNSKTLVILAAGMGTRYGGLKQLDTITNNGNTIIDFSIYDAIRVGFTTIVFIIRKEIKEKIEALYAERIPENIKVDYVIQDVSLIPEKYKNGKREKPWGTGHALLCVKNVVKNNFAIINADDFYGYHAFKIMSKALETSENEQYMVGYQVKNTLSPYGSVSRGECHVESSGVLNSIIERTNIKNHENKIEYTNINTDDKVVLNPETIVSMNFWGFTTDVFEYAEKEFDHFFKENESSDTAEFYLPTIVNAIINKGILKVKVLKTETEWFGVTYKEDKENVINKVRQKIETGEYPMHLWEK